MNHSMHNPHQPEASARNLDHDDRLLDRLVDGELSDAEHRDLLLKFENEPGGWRRCALAFLEAQTWRQALESVATMTEAPMKSTAPDVPRRQRTFWRPVARLSGLAAGLIVAFALGWTYPRGVEQTAPSAGLNQQEGSDANRSAQPSQDGGIKVTTGQSRPIKPAESPGALNSLVKQHLQQRGYSVETEQRLVSMESKDGRKVKLPVQEVRIRYTGDRIY